jgi:hypothetical protein
MFARFIAGLTLTGVLALASTGVASAAAPTAGSGPSGSSGSAPAAGSSGSAGASGGHTFDCARAPQVLEHVADRQARVAMRLGTLQTKEGQAKAAGKTKAAARIDQRITKVQGIQTRLAQRQQKVESLCPGAAPASSSPTPS